MARILVVDGSRHTQNTIKSLIHQSGTSTATSTVEFATSESTALRRLQRHDFDLLLVESGLTRTNNLQLLAAARELSSDLVIVEVIESDSEELRREAVRPGASITVARERLSQELPIIIDRTDSVENRLDQNADSLTRPDHIDFRLVIPNKLSLIQAVVIHIQNMARKVSNISVRELRRLGSGLEEALLNSMIHGNLEVSSELRLEKTNAYHALVKQRASEFPYCDRMLTISVSMRDDWLTCEICDAGPGFNVAAVPNPTAPENLERPCGRGLLLMRAFLDSVEYNKRGNQVTLTKRLADHPAFEIPPMHPLASCDQELAVPCEC